MATSYTALTFHCPILLSAQSGNNVAFSITVPKARVQTCTSLFIRQAFQQAPEASQLTFNVAFPIPYSAARKTLIKFFGMIAPPTSNKKGENLEQEELVPLAFLSQYFKDQRASQHIYDAILNAPLTFEKLSLLKNAAALTKNPSLYTALIQTTFQLLKTLSPKEIPIAQSYLAEALENVSIIPPLQAPAYPFPDWFVDALIATPIPIESITFSSKTVANFPAALREKVLRLSFERTIFFSWDEVLTFPQVKDLTLRGVKLQTIEPLKQLSSLEKLRIEGCDCPPNLDFTPLEALKHLKLASFNNTGITKLNPLYQLPLESLSVEKCDLINDFSSLQAMHRLKTLNVAFTSFQGLQDGNYPLIEELNLRGTKFANLENLACLREALKVLNLTDCNVENLAPLKDFPKLIKLALGGRQTASLEFLLSLKNLSSLAITNCVKPLDTDQLEKCNPLTELFLYNVNVRSLAFLENMHHLRRLSLILCGALEDQLPYILECPALESLTLSGCGNLSSNHIQQLKSRGVTLSSA